MNSPKKIKPLRPPSSRPEETRAEIDLLREKISDLIRKDPQKAAIILTEWMKHSPNRKKAG